MKNIAGGLFGFSDQIKMEALNQRLLRNQVVTANIANAETPGFRAIGYDFEKQLQSLAGSGEPFLMKASHPRHLRTSHTQADGTIRPDVYIRPTESVSEDGNTVDVDLEMGKLATNQILYRGIVDLINKKIGKLRYAISGGA